LGISPEAHELQNAQTTILIINHQLKETIKVLALYTSQGVSNHNQCGTKTAKIYNKNKALK